MSPTQPIASNQDPATPFSRAFNALLNVGRDLLARVQAAIAHQSTSHLPRRFARNPQSAEQRIARTLDWVVALARTLAGDTTWLITPSYVFPRFPGRYPALTAQLRAECGLPPVPPRTEAQKAAAHRRYVRKVFATQPVAKIAARLARRLNIAESADAWPTDLLAIPQTPAAYAKSSPSPAWAAPGWGAVPPAPPPPDKPAPTEAAPTSGTDPPGVESTPHPRL